MVQDDESALEYAIIPGVKQSDDAETLLKSKTWDEIKAYTLQQSNNEATNTGDVTIGTFKATGEGIMDEIANGTPEETQYFLLAVHMKEEAGNKFQDARVIIDITVDATQYTAEEDGFGNNQYDIDASYGKNYLTFSSDDVFTMSIFKNSNLYIYAEGLQSSTDGKTWSAFKATVDYDNPEDSIMPSVTAVKNDADNKYYVYLRGDDMTTLGGEFGGYNVWTQLTIESTELVDCSGNIMNLLDYDNPDVSMGYGAFYMLFRNCTTLRSVPDLPATVLTEWCYYSMFEGCTSLINAPKIGAETFAIGSCWSMFDGCTSLNVVECDVNDSDKFVTIPTGELPYAAVETMFYNTPNASTIGSYGTPVEGKSYKNS